MGTTSITTMKENLSKIKAKELFFYKWTSSDQLFTVVAGDGKKYGNAITIGYVENIDIVKKLKLPIYDYCPFN